MPVNTSQGSVRSVASREKDLNERMMLRRGRFIGEPAPDHRIPEEPMDPMDAKYLIEEELFLDGDPERLGYSQAEKLIEDLKTACEVLGKKGGVAEHERKRVHTATGY
jgi:hypothetical protein